MTEENFPRNPRKRSSLRCHNIDMPASELLLMAQKNRRKSQVAWKDDISGLKVKGLESKVKIEDKNDPTEATKPHSKSIKISSKNKEFVEARRRSIKNEFTIVKELLKNKSEEEDDTEGDEKNKEEEEITEKNTQKNFLFGKNSDTESSENEK